MSKYLKYWLLALILNLEFVDAGHKLCIIGSGYVGLVAGTCLAEFGNNVICADIDAKKIKMLNEGKIPIYEPGLSELISKQVKLNRIEFTTDVSCAIRKSDVLFIAVGTPMDDNGEANLRYVIDVAKTIGQNLGTYKVICTKSTVPVGTGKKIKEIINSENQNGVEFDIASNPEFLKEGAAIDDFLCPNRVVIGVESEKAKKILNEIYEPLIVKQIPFLYTDIVSAETIKYASNSFLATKISFINEIAEFCELNGANILDVASGMGLDERIGMQFLKPGPGFGGSCFPKDIQELMHKAQSQGLKLTILDAAIKVNQRQKKRIFKKLSMLLDNDLAEKKVAILGLAFKANTDDVRYSPAIELIESLLEKKAIVTAYDPLAMKNMKKLLPDIVYANSWQGALNDADAVVVLTDCEEFKKLNLNEVAALVKQKNILDSRNILSVSKLKELNFNYTNIGNAQTK